MKKITKHAVICFLILCMSLGLSACGNYSEDEIMTLVRGNINEIYLGQFDADYLEMVDSTPAAAKQSYLEGLEIEAEYFANYWGIVDANYGESYDDLSDRLQQDIIELYREIYSNTKYEIKSVVRQNDGSYAVKVVVDPIDIMEKASEIYENDEYEPLNTFWDKYAEVDIDAMTDEEYMDYTHEYGEIIVNLVKDQLPDLGYTEQKSQSIQVEEEDGLWTINDDDWAVFDGYVIYYP